MGAALVLLSVALAALATGVLIGRYYVPDDRQLRRSARHGKAFMRALSHLIARDHDTVVRELRAVVEENIDDVEPYFALGAIFRSRGEHERAIRTHQALAMREKEHKKTRTRAIYELALDFRAAGMPRRATRATEEVLFEEPAHEGALRALAALYEEQARFVESAELWQRLGVRRGEDLTEREHHLYAAAAQAAIGRGELDAARDALKHAQTLGPPSAHFYAAAAELAATRGNWRGARERLKQALVADPGIVVHVLPELIAAERARADAVAAGGGIVAETVSLELPAVGGAVGDSADELAEVSPAAAADGTSSTAAPALTTSPSRSTLTPARTSASGIALASGEVEMVADHPSTSVSERVLATLGEIEQQVGPRLEFALIRAQLVTADYVEPVTRDLAARFPDALSARVAAGRLALLAGDAGAIGRRAARARR